MRLGGLSEQSGVVEEGRVADWRPPIRRWPVLRIPVAVRIAFDGSKLIIAAAGILLLHLGWSLLDVAFAASSDLTPDVLPPSAVVRSPDHWSWTSENLVERLGAPASNLIRPLFALLDPGTRGLAMLHALLGLAWLIAVWGCCGGAIARIAVVQEARSQRPGLFEAARFARRSALSLILVPVLPLLAVAFCGLAGLVIGLLYRVPGGPAIAGVVLVIPMLAGALMTLLVAALVAGWPLFHASLAAGADGALDALSRTYSYLNQRLVLFAVGVGVAWFAGLIGLTVVDWMAWGVIRLSRWSLSLAGPPSTVAEMFAGVPEVGGSVAAAAHGFWLGAVRLLAHAWVYSYFWSAAAVIYLGLRHDVDGTPVAVIDPPGAGSRVEHATAGP